MAKSTKQDSATKSSSTKKTTSSRRTDTARSDAPKQARGGIAKPVTPSPELGAIVGSEPLSRAELTKRIWDYIKSNNLQDSKDRRRINADDKLRAVLGQDQVSMFEMTKLVNQHVK